MSALYSNRAAAPKLARFCRMACSIAIVTFSVASCSAVDGTLLGGNGLSRAPSQVSQSVSAPKKSYGYQKTAAIMVASVEAQSQPVAVARMGDLGSSPYTCSPSGFGQKARCYLR